MASLTTYKGLSVLSGSPSGAGGAAINDDFIEIADRLVHLSTSSPSTSDKAPTYFVGQRWFNTATSTEYVLIDDAAGTWKRPSIDLLTTNNTFVGNNIIANTLSASSGTDYGFKITPAYSQTGTANGTDLLVNRTGTSGSGTQLLIDAQVAGASKFSVSTSGVASTSAGGQAGVGTNPLTTSQYVQSRGMNLVANGTGLLLNNYNFPNFAFDSTEVYAGRGSFRINVANGIALSAEFVPVDPSLLYRMTAWGKSGDANGGNYTAANIQYAGVAEFDIDGLSILPQYYMTYPGSSATTLTAALNPGDTTVTLASASGWDNGGSGNAYSRNFRWYGYTNAKGYTYPNYTFSRTVSSDYSSNGSSGAWASSGISGNVITLRVPWAGPAIASGTAVSNLTFGGGYKYIAASNLAVPNAWTRYEGCIGGIDTTGSGYYTLFSPATAFIRLLFLVNYQNAANNNVRWSGLWFGETAGIVATNNGAPYVPHLGQIYFDTSDSHFKGWDGTAWRRLDN